MSLVDASTHATGYEQDEDPGATQEDALVCRRRHLRQGPVVALEGRLEPEPSGWVLRIPLRAEHMAIDKQTYVVEQVAVRTTPVQTATRVQDSVRREELAVEPRGEMEVTRRVHRGE